MSSENHNKPRVLGVIPARGGSKRLPRKNIMKLRGHPLIAYTIRAAQHSDTISEFLVSSEDEEILKIASDYDAPVPFIRPKELAGDEIRNIEVVRHAMEFMETRLKVKYDILVLLQPTCPIRDPVHIDMAVMRLWKSDMPTAVSVKGPYKKRDPILKRIKDNLLEPLYRQNDIEMNETFYLYNASIYAVKREYFLKKQKLISEKQIPVLMDAYHSIDIDAMADFLVAESYLSHLIDAGLRKEME